MVTYDAAKIAEDPEAFRGQFTDLLKPAHVCVTLVRQRRGKFQNVNFMAECIDTAGLKTFLIAKTGTPDPTYEVRRNSTRQTSRQLLRRIALCAPTTLPIITSGW